MMMNVHVAVVSFSSRPSPGFLYALLLVLLGPGRADGERSIFSAVPGATAEEKEIEEQQPPASSAPSDARQNEKRNTDEHLPFPWWDYFGPVSLRQLALGLDHGGTRTTTSRTRSELLNGFTWGELVDMQPPFATVSLKEREHEMLTKQNNDYEDKEPARPSTASSTTTSTSPAHDTTIKKAIPKRNSEVLMARIQSPTERCRNRLATYDAETQVGDAKGNQWTQVISEFNILACGDPRLDGASPDRMEYKNADRESGEAATADEPSSADGNTKTTAAAPRPSARAPASSATTAHPSFRAAELVADTVHDFRIATYSDFVQRDRLISSCALFAGEWEQQGSFLIKNLLQQYAHPEDTLFLDAGANIGYFSLLAAKQGFDTLSVEMALANAIHIARSAVVHNPGLQDKLTLYLLALWSAQKTGGLGNDRGTSKTTDDGDEDDHKEDAWPLTAVMNDFKDNSGLYEVYHVLEQANSALRNAFSPRTEGYGLAWTVKKSLDEVLRNYLRKKKRDVLAELDEEAENSKTTGNDDAMHNPGAVERTDPRRHEHDDRPAQRPSHLKTTSSTILDDSNVGDAPPVLRASSRKNRARAGRVVQWGRLFYVRKSGRGTRKNYKSSSSNHQTTSGDVEQDEELTMENLEPLIQDEHDEDDSRTPTRTTDGEEEQQTEDEDQAFCADVDPHWVQFEHVNYHFRKYNRRHHCAWKRRSLKVVLKLDLEKSICNTLSGFRDFLYAAVDKKSGLYQIDADTFIRVEVLAVFAEGDHMDVPGEFFKKFFHHRQPPAEQRNCFYALRDLFGTSKAGHKFYGGSYESDNVSGEVAWVNQRYMPAGVAWSLVRHARLFPTLHCIANGKNQSIMMPPDFQLGDWEAGHLRRMLLGKGTSPATWSTTSRATQECNAEIEINPNPLGFDFRLARKSDNATNWITYSYGDIEAAIARVRTNFREEVLAWN
ncbi:unnamed protein product [Amoebophrya sp. A120]|nr:unnamed protein product [Amoebophrya sp. A120]|eukprot:GSA120T00024936001.1